MNSIYACASAFLRNSICENVIALTPAGDQDAWTAVTELEIPPHRMPSLVLWSAFYLFYKKRFRKKTRFVSFNTNLDQI